MKTYHQGEKRFKKILRGGEIVIVHNWPLRLLGTLTNRSRFILIFNAWDTGYPVKPGYTTYPLLEALPDELDVGDAGLLHFAVLCNSTRQLGMHTIWIYCISNQYDKINAKASLEVKNLILIFDTWLCLH